MAVHQTDFSTGKVSKNILEIAIPLATAQLANLLYHVIDRMFIGRIPGCGTLALTGLGLCFPIIIAISAFSRLLGSGGAPLCSIERGKDNYEEAEKILGTSFSLLILAGIILMILGFIFMKPLLYTFGASDYTYGYASEYLSIYLCGTIFVMINLGLNSYISCQGFGPMSMATVLVGTVINTILDPIFIFVLDMGIKGAAIATVISQFVSSAMIVIFLISTKAVIRLKLKNLAISLSRALRIMALGCSSFIMAITTSAVQIVCNASLQTYGGDIYIGLLTIMNSIREIIELPALGLADGAVPVISFNYGNQSYDRAKKGIRFLSISAITYTTIVWFVVFTFPQIFIQIFTNNEEVIRLGIPALRIYFACFFCMALQYSGQSVFLALNKPKRAIFFSLLRKVIIVIPLTLLFPLILKNGVNGIFMAEPVSHIVGGTASFITMLCTILPELKRKQVLKNDMKKAENKGSHSSNKDSLFFMDS